MRKERELNKAIGPGPLTVVDDAFREKKCLAEVNQVLKKYDCVLVPKMVPTISVTATPRGLSK